MPRAPVPARRIHARAARYRAFAGCVGKNLSCVKARVSRRLLPRCLPASEPATFWNRLDNNNPLVSI
jgi:hypothetical protein